MPREIKGRIVGFYGHGPESTMILTPRGKIIYVDGYVQRVDGKLLRPPRKKKKREAFDPEAARWNTDD